MSASRRYDLDWLRVLAFAVLVPFHAGVLFAPSWEAHIKNPVLWPSLEYPMMFVHQWRLPLLFVISGIGTNLALRKRSLRAYLKERTERLLLPLLVGILIAVPPQVYVERVARGQFSGNFLEFYPRFFTPAVYPVGNLSWHHLWFIAYLFAMSIVAAPLLVRLRDGNPLITRLRSALNTRFGVFLPLLPLCIGEVALRPHFPTRYDLISDWASLTLYFQHFLLGYVIATDEAVWHRLADSRRIALLAGLGLFPLMAWTFWWRGYPFVGYSAELQIDGLEGLSYHVVRTVHLWCWVVAFLGYASKYLNRPNTGMQKANQAVYPFYILHQTVIVLLGYGLLAWTVAAPIKFVVIIATTFVITALLYRVLILPFRLARALFGVKLQPNVEVAAMRDARKASPADSATL